MKGASAWAATETQLGSQSDALVTVARAYLPIAMQLEIDFLLFGTSSCGALLAVAAPPCADPCRHKA